MQIMQSRRRFLAASFATATGLVSAPRSLRAEPPPETTTIRLPRWIGSAYCWAAEYFAEDLLRAEGFTDVRYIQGDPKVDQDIGHVVLSTTTDRPWSQQFCCMISVTSEFEKSYPAATKRVLRAIFNAADLCFCAVCGSRLLWAPTDTKDEWATNVAVCAFDSPADVQPHCHTYTDTKLPWLHVPAPRPCWRILGDDEVGNSIAPSRPGRSRGVIESIPHSAVARAI